MVLALVLLASSRSGQQKQSVRRSRPVSYRDAYWLAYYTWLHRLSILDSDVSPCNLHLQESVP